MVFSPCKVHNFMAQPTFGTDYVTKEEVQLVQMSPVFVQNVQVGRCSSKNPDPDPNFVEGLDNYFVCKQRYSTVEVYVSKYPGGVLSLSGSDEQASEVQLSKYPVTNLIRRPVIVESGCDFTFNFLPIIIKKANQQRQGEIENVEQNVRDYQYLRSPYNSELFEQINIETGNHIPVPVTSTSPIIPAIANQYGTTDSFNETEKNYPVSDSEQQLQVPKDEIVKTATRDEAKVGSLSRKQGFIKMFKDASRRKALLPKKVLPVLPVTSEAVVTYAAPTESEGVRQGTTDEALPDGDSNNSDGGNRETGDDRYSNKSLAQKGTSGEEGEGDGVPESTGYEKDMQNASNKIGLPIYITRREWDTLLNNVELEPYSDSVVSQKQYGTAY